MLKPLLDDGPCYGPATAIGKTSEITTKTEPWSRTDALTAREHEVLRLVARGLSAKEAAKELLIAARAVESHIRHIQLKTCTRNRTHMVAHAFRAGLVRS